MGIAANKSFPHGTYYLEVDLEFKNYLEKETTIKDSLEWLGVLLVQYYGLPKMP